MRLDIASTIQPGNIVYNCFMEPLTVDQKIVHTSNAYYIQFIVRDNNNNTHNYFCKDLYMADLEGEDDAEKAWVNWAKDNKDFLATFDHIETTKEIFKTGFGQGFEHKRQYSYEEMMQK